ncbi:unnamed protein product [Effrenium voratum]|uniref:Uncharacterized protein n=1 Tax=Effrenium voratum TaxID=2562239 RepID=A0AA36N651_9DINO|nr:unnamed protein product [Effrenium voratum]
MSGWVLSACFAALLSFAAGTDCLSETGVCYQGTNLAITLDVNSVAEGCQEVGNAAACCDLCGQYWPQCLSWQYIIEGNNDNGYSGMSFYCCLKGSFRPDPLSAAYCTSGYFNPQCTLTAACSFDVSGSGLGYDSSVMALDASSSSCGAGSAEAWDGLSNPHNATSFTDALATFDLGTAAGGTAGDYLLCYGASGASASVADYPTQVGVFTVKGPSSGQDFSCTLGADCSLTLAGYSQSATSAAYKALVVPGSTCGTGNAAADFSGSFENPRIVWDNENDNYYEMKTGAMGDTTATYSLCWAANPATLDDYVFRVGSFTMQGPTSGMSHVCTLGQTCDVTLQGTGFTDANGLLVAFGSYAVDTGSVCAFLVDELVASLGSSFSHPALPQASPYTTFSFGRALSAHSNQPGSGYRLCWSATPSQVPPSKVNSDYAIDSGLFTMHGPVLSDHQCILTLPCTLTLTGSGFDQGAHGLVLLGEGATCGGSWGTINASGADWGNPATDSGASDDTFSFGTPTEGTANSNYVICWGFQPAGESDYNVYVGILELGGPDLIQGSSCVKGENCVLALTGIAFASTNKLLVLDVGSSCGAGATSATFSPMEVEKQVQDGTFTEYQLGSPNTGTAQSGYTLCWAASPASVADFALTLGDFTVTGPNVQDVSCTFGLSCVLELIGLELQSSNKMIVLSAGSCGDNGPTLASVTGMLNAINVDAQMPYNTYDLGTPSAGQPRTDYLLCWSSAPADGAGAAFYKVPVGYLTLNGPVQVSQHCIMGTQCSITLTGVGLAAFNQILIIDAAGSCGSTTPSTAVFDGLTNPVSPDSGNVALYNLGIARTTSDGPGSGYIACWGHNASYDYWNIQLGTFSIDGPDLQTSLVYCTLGLPCSLTLTGVNLAATNKIVVTALSDTCGQSALNLAVFAGASNPTNATADGTYDTFELGTPTGGMPGDYKVCWGFDPSADGDFHVPVLTLRMGGPVARSSECTLSEPCKIEVEGVRLAHTSRLLFISTSSNCGDTSPTVISWSGINNPAGTDLLIAPADPGYVYADGDRYDAGLGYAGVPGSYKICWSFDPPGAYSDYKVTLGDFVMNGPIQNMAVSCTLGQACVVEPSGVGLNETNQVQLITTGTCGSAAVVQATIQGLVNPVLVADGKFTLGGAVLGGSYATCRVPTPAEGCIGSHYRMCWAHGVYQGGANYVVELGTFSMNGPFGTYRVDCTMGSICSFILYGSMLALTNRVVILDMASSCGDATVVSAFAGLLNPAPFSQLATDGSSATARLGKSHAGRPGAYKLCWGYEPSTLADFKVDVGIFYFHDVPQGCEPGVFAAVCATPR